MEKLIANKKERALQNIAIVVLFGVAIFLSIGALFWIIPRNVVDLTLNVPEESYTLTDTIAYEVIIETFGRADNTYDVRLVCRDGTIEERVFIRSITAQTEPRPAGRSTPEIDLRDIATPPTGDNCAIQITSRAHIMVLPLLYKDITEVYESNTFKIVE